MPKIIVKKEEWINLGYELFAEQGDSGIVVEKMAKKLKVNKSSFYWYFKTKENFIKELIMFYINKETTRIIDLTNSLQVGLEKFKTFIALIYKQDPYFDFVFYLKRYARKKKEIQTIVDEIDYKRIEYACTILQEMGYSKQEAKIKATFLHKHFIGYHETIRYKEQSPDYEKEVRKELNLVIKY
ncbi:MAG: TetR/AcrR family transcriptional regulator [Bacteroidales bacterium]|nr:TetR/AcrR family transcriptional regulator [Bacteroidales bacterium]